MIDPNLPLELDDGTPVEFISSHDGYVEVQLPKDKNYRRGDTGPVYGRRYTYETATGVWAGGSEKRMFTLRNAVDDPSKFEFDV